MSIEVMQMITSIIAVIAIIFSGIMLGLSRRTFRLQRKNLQANMFNDITNRINELFDNVPSKDKKTESLNWHTKILNVFEYFSFFANNGYLEDKMVSHYENFITGYCDRLEEKSPDSLQRIQKAQHPGQYDELRIYYKKFKCKDAPF